MNQSVHKALRILDLFTEDTQELTLKEISYRSYLPKATAYRLLSTLEAAHFLHKTKKNEHDSTYRLGLKLLELGHLVSDQLEIRKIALPDMEELVADINEAVHLVIKHHHKAVYIEKVDSTRALRLNTRIGKNTPLHAGSGPKLLLAHLPQHEQEEALQEAGLCGQATEQLKDELEHIRERGFAYSESEQDADTTGISYPVRDFQDRVVAALAVSGLSSRFEGDYLDRIKKSTERTALKISQKLGHPVSNQSSSDAGFR